MSNLAKLRRLVNEQSSEIYTDEILTELLTENNNDVYAVAADIWLEKAAAVMAFDFSADGGTFNKSQLHKQYLTQREICLSKAKGHIVKSTPTPLTRDYQVIITN